MGRSRPVWKSPCNRASRPGVVCLVLTLALFAGVRDVCRAAGRSARGDKRGQRPGPGAGLKTPSSGSLSTGGLFARGQGRVGDGPRQAADIRIRQEAPRRGFNPTRFDALAWVKLARSAGAKYITITAKHHDGFCMSASRLTDYDIVDATPYHADPLKAAG